MLFDKPHEKYVENIEFKTLKTVSGESEQKLSGIFENASREILIAFSLSRVAISKISIGSERLLWEIEEGTVSNYRNEVSQ